MTEKYVVEVAAPREGESDAAAAQLARVLKLDVARVATLIDRLPDVVTKPISRREAAVVVERFTQAGLQAQLRQAGTGNGKKARTQPPAAAAPAPEPARKATVVQADDDLVLVTDGPPPARPEPAVRKREPIPMEKQTGDISPADLQARLRSAGQPAAEALHADTRHQAGSAAVADAPSVPAPSAPTIVATSAAADGTPAAAEPKARTRAPRKRRRGSLQAKLVSLAIIPVLLTIAGALAATWFTARPALYQQLLDSARNPAIATAASLSSAFEQPATGDATTASGIDYLQLQQTILITRQAFPREDIAFIIATDTKGDALPGFFAGAESLAS
jgi:hypothetical protein